MAISSSHLFGRVADEVVDDSLVDPIGCHVADEAVTQADVEETIRILTAAVRRAMLLREKRDMSSAKARPRRRRGKAASR